MQAWRPTTGRRTITTPDCAIPALAAAGIEPIDLAMCEQTQQRIEAMPAAQCRWLLRELRQWHRKAHRNSRDGDTDLADHLRTAQQRLLAEPVYYLHDNRDNAKE